MNVNNPHFLIMQGRVTKVLNMKPREVLFMVEEAAGVRVYEAKRVAAMMTIEKKAHKIDNMNRVSAFEESKNYLLTLLFRWWTKKSFLAWTSSEANVIFTMNISNWAVISNNKNVCRFASSFGELV